MLFTLHRYIFRELLRVFLLAVVALTLMLSLGSILQPVQEYGVGPRQVLHFMGYFLPITLTFVLPMAALFACSLVYGRFAGDSELDACRASGISLRRLVYPGLALAIMVTAANLLLSFYVMPVFVHRAEKSLKTDAKKILFRNIQRRRYYALPPEEKYLIYADHADLENSSLSGVIVTEMKNNNEIKDIFTAQKAEIKFNPHERFNEVQILVYKSSQMGAESEAGAEWGSMTVELGSMISDQIKFKKIDEMREIEADLMNFYPIEKLARDTYAQIIIELLAHDINTTMIAPNKISAEDANDPGQYYELLGIPNSFKFIAGRCSAQEEELELSGENEVVIKEYDTDSGQTIRTLICEKALLHIEGDKLAPTLTMDIYNASEQGSDELTMRIIILGLIPPKATDVIANEIKTESGSLRVEKLTSDLSQISELQPSGILRNLQSSLAREIRRALVRIKAEIHTRLVFGTGCIPMILIGIGLGIMKKGGHLLSAFGASCIPAAVLIVCIMSGKNLIKSHGSESFTGVALMWSGLVFLLLLVVVIYRRLLKN
ncbi:MAG: LptF/LptG family permease [Planctomycetota bacterium]|jgi:lipopolysaccharide export LptBFGC system permease protein LptF